jgi:hypothetical protein
MAQNTGQSFGQMLQNANTMCYMKGIASVSSGVTVTKGGVAASEAFTQGSSDKTVVVHVQNMQNGGGGGGGGPTSMDVHFKVFGTNSVTSDVYKAELYFFGNGSVNQSEVVSVTRSSGAFTDTSTGSDHLSTILAHLKTDSSGSLAFDLSQDRNSSSMYSGQGSVFKSDVTITGDNKILAKSYSNSTWGVGKNYSISTFAGDSLKNLQFLSAGYKGENSSTYNGQSFTNTNVAGIEYHDTYYASVDSDLKTQAGLIDFSTDSFYSSGLTLSSPDYSAYDCSASGDVEINMDFSSEGVSALQTKCEGDRFDNYDLCNSTAIQSAMQKTWN